MVEKECWEGGSLEKRTTDCTSDLKKNSALSRREKKAAGEFIRFEK